MAEQKHISKAEQRRTWKRRAAVRRGRERRNAWLETTNPATGRENGSKR